MLWVENYFKKQSEQKILLYFVLIWFGLNFFQSILTELADDEAYYWVWSQHLNWGFYEHPPMVALFIRWGGLFSSAELGVRWLTLITSSITIYIVFINFIKQGIWLYIALISSILILHFGSFLTAPDSPLFFFTALFFIAFKNYLEVNSFKNSIVLSLIIAAMMYSKYHAVLIISISFLSNIKLLKRKSFWIITLGSLILYTPHIYWLFTKGQKGLNYALSDRFQDAWNYANVLNYISGQLLVFGPLLGVVIIYAAIKVQVANRFERTLQRLVIFMFLYFFIWSFRGIIQANWTATLFIPLVILSHKYLQVNLRLKRWVYYLWLPSFFIILLLRLHIAFNILPLTRSQNRSNEFFGWKDYARRIDSLAQGKPVLTGSYQSASKLWFYRNKKTIPINCSKRVNQFYEWDQYEKEILDSTVLVVRDFLMGENGKIEERGRQVGYQWVKEFRSYREATLSLQEKLPDNLKAGEEISVDINVSAPPKWCILAKGETVCPAYLAYNIEKKDLVDSLIWNQGITYFNQELCSDSTFTLQFKVPTTKGSYRVQFFIFTENLVPWYSNCEHDFKVE